MNRFVLPLLLLTGALCWGQTAPDCQYTKTFTNTTPQSPAFNNKPTTTSGVACNAYVVAYWTNGASGVSVQIEGAPDVAGVPGSYTALTAATTPIASANPATGTTSGIILACCDYYPWIRINPTTFTGTNQTMTVRVYGWKSPTQVAGGGSGGGGGSGTVTRVTIAGTTNQINVTGTCTITTSGTCTLSLPNAVIVGTDGSAAGTLQLANAAANAHTIWGSGATTSNTIDGFTAAPANGDIVTCTITGTTCLLTDGGPVPTGTVSSVTIAGTSNEINVTGTCTITATGVCTLSIANSAALPGSPTTTTQTQNDNSTKIATTAYTDLAVANAIAGVNPAVAVLAASTASLTGTYSNGVSGVGATFTVTATGAFSLDGVAINTIGQRVLLKNQASAFQNGVYFATVVGAVAVSPVFTRALDYDTPSDINSTGAIPVQSGTANATTSWLLTSTVNTVGTDALTYVQFSLAPSNIVLAVSPGVGLCHFAGATQFCTSSAVNLAGTDVTGVLPTANIPTALTNQTSINGVTVPSAVGSATLGQVVASGQAAMPTGALSGNTCSASATTATATGAATTDAIEVTYASDPTGVTGYGGGTSGGITVRPWPTSNTINFKLCNESGGSITPGALNINWRIVR